MNWNLISLNICKILLIQPAIKSKIKVVNTQQKQNGLSLKFLTFVKDTLLSEQFYWRPRMQIFKLSLREKLEKSDFFEYMQNHYYIGNTKFGKKGQTHLEKGKKNWKKCNIIMNDNQQ